MNLVNKYSCCERVKNFICDHALEGAKVAAGVGVVTRVCGPVIAGLGLASYQIYKNFFKTPPYAHHLESQLFRRLSPKVQKEIIAKIEKQPKLGMDAIRALREGDVDHSIFKRENWTDAAMKAYFEGQIDASTLHRLMIYEACRNESNGHVESVKVFEPGGIQSLKQALTHELPYYDDQKEENGEVDCFLNEDQWNQLIESLRDDPNKAQFFLIPYPSREDNPELWSAIENTKLALDKKHIFILRKGIGFKLAILPPDLLMKVLKLKYGEENVPKALNIFGEREVESLSGNSRPVRIPCHPYLPCPKTIHEGVPATDLAFYLHDIFYHLLIESSMGREHRNLWIDLARWVKPKNLEAFKYVLDKDMRAYSEATQYSKHDRFWMSLVRVTRAFPEVTSLILVYISKGKCGDINLEQFRNLYEKFRGDPHFGSIMGLIESMERLPGITDMEYDRNLSMLAPPK